MWYRAVPLLSGHACTGPPKEPPPFVLCNPRPSQAIPPLVVPCNPPQRTSPPLVLYNPPPPNKPPPVPARTGGAQPAQPLVLWQPPPGSPKQPPHPPLSGRSPLEPELGPEATIGSSSGSKGWLGTSNLLSGWMNFLTFFLESDLAGFGSCADLCSDPLNFLQPWTMFTVTCWACDVFGLKAAHRFPTWSCKSHNVKDWMAGCADRQGGALHSEKWTSQKLLYRSVFNVHAKVPHLLNWKEYGNLTFVQNVNACCNPTSVCTIIAKVNNQSFFWL